MDGGSPSLVSAVTGQVLELLADAHIARRLTVKESPAFHRLTGVIDAYGKALTLLVALQKREEIYAIMAVHPPLCPQRDFPPRSRAHVPLTRLPEKMGTGGLTGTGSDARLTDDVLSQVITTLPEGLIRTGQISSGCTLSWAHREAAQSDGENCFHSSSKRKIST